MTENQKPKGFSLVNLIGNIWGMHVVIAALLYPRPLLPSNKDDPRETPYQMISLLGGTLLLFVNLMVLVALFTRILLFICPAWADPAAAFLSALFIRPAAPVDAVKAFLIVFFTHTTWIDIAKVFFVFYTWLLIGVVFIAFNHLSDIYDLFMLLEQAAIQSRDESAMLIRSTEARLEAWDRKLMTVQNTEISFAAFFKKATPLIVLFLRKEKNMLDIGLEAFKLVCSNMQLFKKFF